MSIKKKTMITLVLTLAILCSAVTVCQAQILAPRGPGQIGYQTIVLCESLSAYKERSSDSEVVETLKYGDQIIAMTSSGEDGWVQVALGDDVDGVPVWVRSDYVVINPSWYQTDGSTPVYAWAETGAKKVGLISAGNQLPILKDDGDWVCVSLRGASGWIRKTDADYSVSQSSSSSGSSSEKESSGNSSNQEAEDNSFVVYARDGSTSYIHHVEGAMYEDSRGRTYSKDGDDEYYCISTDTTYSEDPDHWSSQNWTGRDFGEIADETMGDDDDGDDDDEDVDDEDVDDEDVDDEDEN